MCAPRYRARCPICALPPAGPGYSRRVFARPGINRVPRLSCSNGSLAMTRIARFERSVLPYLDAAYNVARWLTRDDQDAQDVVQESMLRAFRYFDSLKDTDARAWLLAIVRNTGYTWLEKNRPAEIVAFDEGGAGDEAESASLWPVAESNPEVIVLQGAQRKLVAQALEELPVSYREI